MATGEYVTHQELAVVLEGLATKEDLERFATKEDLQQLEDRLDAKFASKDDLRRMEDKLDAKFAGLYALIRDYLLNDLMTGTVETERHRQAGPGVQRDSVAGLDAKLGVARQKDAKKGASTTRWPLVLFYRRRSIAAKYRASYVPSLARSNPIFSSTSSIESAGNEATTSALRARQSKLLTWSDSTTPATFRPGGMTTSKGYPLTWRVIGQNKARPTLPL